MCWAEELLYVGCMTEFAGVIILKVHCLGLLGREVNCQSETRDHTGWDPAGPVSPLSLHCLRLPQARHLQRGFALTSIGSQHLRARCHGVHDTQRASDLAPRWVPSLAWGQQATAHGPSAACFLLLFLCDKNGFYLFNWLKGKWKE